MRRFSTVFCFVSPLEFSQCLSGSFLLGFARFYLVLPSFTGFQQVLLDFTGFYWVLLGFT